MCLYVKFPIIKSKEYLTEENSCFVVLTKYLNERLNRHCRFPNERPFPGLRGAFIWAGTLIKYFSCEGGFVWVGALFGIIAV